MELRLRPSAKTAISKTATMPATVPENICANQPIKPKPMIAAPWTRQPNTYTVLRMASWRMRAEIASCGSIASDSRTGTSKPSAQVGVPMASSNQASTSLGSARPSPTFVRPSDTICTP